MFAKVHKHTHTHIYKHTNTHTHTHTHTHTRMLFYAHKLYALAFLCTDQIDVMYACP